VKVEEERFIKVGRNGAPLLTVCSHTEVYNPHLRVSPVLNIKGIDKYKFRVVAMFLFNIVHNNDLN